MNRAQNYGMARGRTVKVKFTRPRVTVTAED